MVVVTEVELVAALRAAMVEDGPGDGDGFVTTMELCSVMGLNEQRVRQLLRLVLNKGQLVVGSKPMSDISGRVTHVPAYKLKA